jgi:tetratricopeptide (TPR) repeat protein
MQAVALIAEDQRELMENHSRSPEFRLARANDCNDLTWILISAQRLGEAEQSIHLAMELKRGLVADFPELGEYRFHLAHSLFGLGLVHQDAGRNDAALQVRLEAHDLLIELAHDSATLKKFREHLGHTLWTLGDLWLAANRSDDAAAAFQAALDVFQQLSAAEPNNTYFRQEQGFTLRKLGDAMNQAGRIDEEERHCRMALAEYLRLSAENPDSLFYRQEAAESHYRLAGVLQRTQRVADAEEELERATQLEHDYVPLYRAIGDKYAELGRWNLAAAAYDRGIRLDPSDSWHWLRLATTQLSAGDVAGYRHTCRAMLEQFSGTDNPVEAERTAKTLSLVPVTAEELLTILPLAERSVDGTEQHRDYRWFVLSRALVECRAGKAAETATWIARFAPREVGVHYDALAFSILALSQFGAEQRAEAQATLAKAEAILTQHLPGFESGRPIPVTDFHDWLQAWLIYREAAMSPDNKSTGSIPITPTAE